MRISTGQVFTNANRNMMDNQTSLLDIQNKLASGKEFTRLAEDPVGANRVVNLKRELAQLDMFQSNVDVARRRLELEETTLDDLNTAQDRMRELVLQAANGTLSDADRQMISYELEDLVDYAAGLMNTRDAKGEYLFSGSQGNQQTYVIEDERYVFQGDTTTRTIQISSALYVESSDSGQFLFESVQGEPDLAATGLMRDAFDGVEVTDIDSFEALMRRTGDISVGVDRHDDGLGNPNSITYSYTLRDSAGNLVEDADGNELKNIAYDGIDVVEVELDGAVVTLDLPTAANFPTQTPGVEVGGALDPGLTTVNVTDVDAYTNLMRTEGDLALKVTGYNSGTGQFTYEIDGQVTDDIVTGTSTNPVTINLAGVDLTFELPLPEDVDGGYPAEATLRYAPPAEGELSLSYDRPPTNILNAMLDTIEMMRDPAKGDAQAMTALQERFALTLDQLTQSQERMSEATASFGARLNILDSAEFSNTDFELLTKSALSSVQDLDYAAASTELSKRQLALEAAYASFAKIQGLSLFNYIN